MTGSLDDDRLGDLVLRENFLSEEELEICMKARGENQPPLTLSEVMVQKEFITPAQLNRILQKNLSLPVDSPSSSDRFGDLAVRKGFVSEDQILECLEEQKAGHEEGRNLRLGQILMQRRMLTTQQFLEVLQAQESLSVNCSGCGQTFLKEELDQNNGGLPCCPGCRSASDELPPTPPSRAPESDIVTLRTPFPVDPENGEESNRYRLIQQIVKNPCTVTYQAYDRTRGEVVVLKMIRKEAVNSSFCEKFFHEAGRMKDAVHPSLIQVLDVGLWDGCAYFTMEYEEGRSLERRIRENRFSPLETARVMEAISSSLESLHTRGICHGNIKATNILFTRDEEVRFSDAGLREDVSDFVPPERVGNPREGSDIRGDVYSLGVVLYEMLTGKLPFESVPRESLEKAILSRVPRSPREVDENVPADLEAVCLRAMEKDPLMRYGSAEEFVGDLKRFLEGEPVRSRQGSTIFKVVRGIRGFRRKVIVAAICAPVIVAGIYYLAKPEKDSPQNGNDPRQQDLRGEAEPHLIRAREFITDAGVIPTSLGDLEKALRETSFRIDRIAGLCKDPIRNQLRSAAEDYRKTSLQIRGGGAAKESIREQIRKAERKISNAGLNDENLSAETQKQIRGIEEEKRAIFRQWQRVAAWPADVKKAFLSGLVELEKALALDPNYAEALQLQGRILHRLWRLDAAATAFKKALALPEAERKPDLHYDYACLLFSRWALFRGLPLVILDSEGQQLSLSPTNQPVDLIARHLRIYLNQGIRLPQKFRLLSRAMLEVIGEDVPEQERVRPYLPDEIFKDTEGAPFAYRTLGFLYLKRKEFRRSYNDFIGSVHSDWLHSRTSIEALCLYPRPALELLRSYLEGVSPSTSVSRFNRAVVFLTLADESGARKGFEELLQDDPDYFPARVRLIRLDLKEAGRFREGAASSGKRLRTLWKSSLEFCDKALKVHPRDLSLRALRAEIIFASRKGGAVSTEVDALLRERPGDPSLLYLEAQSYLVQGAADRAMRSAKRALHAVPTFAQANEIRARSRFQVRDFLGAMEDVNRALIFNPELISAYVTRARIFAYQTKKNTDAAERDLAEARKQNPGYPEIWFWRGEILELKIRENTPQEEGRSLRRNSLACYEESIRVDPGYAEAHVMRAIRRLQLGISRTTKELSKVVKRFPDCGLGYMLRGQIFYGNRKYKEAIQDWEVARKLLPSQQSVLREYLRTARGRLAHIKNIPEWSKRMEHTQTHIKERQYDQARKEFSDLVGILPKKIPQDEEQLRLLIIFAYNYACVLSVHADSLGEQEREKYRDKAFYWLRIACRLGWQSWPDPCHSSANEHMKNDQDLKGLRNQHRFNRLLGYSDE